MGTTRDTITSPPPSMIPPQPHRQAPTVHGINSRIVFLTLSDVLCVRCQYIGIHSRNVFLNHSGLILQKKIRKFAENKQTNRQTNRQRIQIQRPLLSPVDCRGERANKRNKFNEKLSLYIIITF